MDKKAIEELRLRNSELEEELNLVVLNEEAKRKVITHHLKSPLNSIDSNVKRMLMDLKEKEKEMQRLREKHPHDEEVGKTTNELSFLIRKYSTLIQNGVQLGIDLISGIAYESASTDELKKDWQKTDPIKKTEDTIEAHHHMIILRNLGLSFQYTKEDSEQEVLMNKYAFIAALSNTLSNAIKYSSEGSVIKLVSHFEPDRKSYNFEIENMVQRPINIPDVLRKIKQGYTREEIEDGAFYELNQGIGLESVINILEKLGGEYELSSGDSFKLQEEKVKGMKRKTYGIIPPVQYVPPLPSFYFKASIPVAEE
ncbi:sensor histidine kinase [Candidatus Pacearchaeota archaeon]|nr:sensor histidine kinase [Candidatus Pacearchaeota archaeon]